MTSRSSGLAKATGVGWLVLGSALAFGCSAPYEPDLQFWPDDGAVTSTGGRISQESGGNGTSGSANVPTGGSDPGGGGTLSTGGGASGASGSTQTLGGAGGTGGSGTSGGGGNLGGSVDGGGNAGSSSSGGAVSAQDCSLSVKVTTASAGGRYAPRNIGAIWVADKSGNFIRSLEVWAQRRVNYLSLWNAASSKAGAAGSRVDIVSQATLTTHKAHTTSWNCRDFNKLPVPDGTYRIYFEMTDKSGTGPNRFQEFSKGAASATLTPADDNNFKAMELSFKP